MNYKVVSTPDFKRAAKRFAKKYVSFKSDLSQFIRSLSENPHQGTHLGNGLYKTRLAISLKNKGKSGGARIITFIIATDKEIYLVYIYEKGQLDNLSKKKIEVLLRDSGLI